MSDKWLVGRRVQIHPRIHLYIMSHVQTVLVDTMFLNPLNLLRFRGGSGSWVRSSKINLHWRGICRWGRSSVFASACMCQDSMVFQNFPADHGCSLFVCPQKRMLLEVNVLIHYCRVILFKFHHVTYCNLFCSSYTSLYGISSLHFSCC